LIDGPELSAGAGYAGDHRAASEEHGRDWPLLLLLCVVAAAEIAVLVAWLW
jgi:hypothetical protein